VRAPPTLDELNRLLISHALAAVASPRLRQPAREGKPDDLPVHNSFDDHAGRLPAPIEARKRGVTVGTLLQRSGSPRRPKRDTASMWNGDIECWGGRRWGLIISHMRAELLELHVPSLVRSASVRASREYPRRHLLPLLHTVRRKRS